MKRSLLALALWIGGCYALRFELMEHERWVVLCEASTPHWGCALRDTLGMAIHLKVLVWMALLLALPGWLLRGNGGWLLAWGGLLTGIAALLLYSATAGSFIVVLCALRLASTPRHSATVRRSETNIQPTA